MLGSSVVVFAVLLSSGASVAAEDVEALFKKGSELRREGRDRDALVLFQHVAQLQNSPRAAAQIALAEQALGLWPDANTHLAAALKNDGDAWIKKNRAALDAALASIRTHLGQVEVWGAPVGASIILDGKPVGSLPTITAWLAPGNVPLQVKADGYEEALRTVKVEQGGRAREHIELRRAPPPLATVARSTEPAVVPPVEAATTPPLSIAAPEPAAESSNSTSTMLLGKPGSPTTPAADGEPSPLYRKWWFWTLVGAGVIAGGGTAAWLISHRGTSSSACTPAPCSTWQ